MMKKILFLCGLLIVALIIAACSPQSQLPPEEGFDGATALAGKAKKIKFSPVDSCSKSGDADSSEFVKGTLQFTKKGKSYSYEDKCYKNGLVEYYCKDGKGITRAGVKCENGCVDGTCKKVKGTAQELESCETAEDCSPDVINAVCIDNLAKDYTFCMGDNDGDGVVNNQPDVCYNPGVTLVTEKGCPDEDQDGVKDSELGNGFNADQCLNTPKGVIVKSNGCTEEYNTKLAQCLNNKEVKVYLISKENGAMFPQEEIFASAWDKLNVVDCETGSEDLCEGIFSKGIIWEFSDGSTLEKVQTPATVSEKAGC